MGVAAGEHAGGHRPTTYLPLHGLKADSGGGAVFPPLDWRPSTGRWRPVRSAATMGTIGASSAEGSEHASDHRRRRRHGALGHPALLSPPPPLAPLTSFPRQSPVD